VSTDIGKYRSRDSTELSHPESDHRSHDASGQHVERRDEQRLLDGESQKRLRKPLRFKWLCDFPTAKRAREPLPSPPARSAFAEIDLGMAGRMGERHEDLARPGAGDPISIRLCALSCSSCRRCCGFLVVIAHRKASPYWQIVVKFLESMRCSGARNSESETRAYALQRR
jgi:hypothetical protein